MSFHNSSVPLKYLFIRNAANRLRRNRGPHADIDLNDLESSSSSSEGQSASESEEAKEPRDDDQPCSCRPELLIVDDEQFNHTAVRVMLTTYFGIEPVSVYNGQQAVDLFTQRSRRECKCSNRCFKLVLMDIQMPVLNGLEAAERIK